MKTYWNLTSIALLTCALVMPVIAPAVGPIQTETQRRDRTQDEWRTIATVSGAAALLGLLKKDKTLTFAGAAGTLYALYRYDEDAKSKDRLARARAQFFNRDYFYRDGVRYDRRTVSKNGDEYYQFYRAPKNHQDWKARGLHDNRNNPNSNRNHDKHGYKGKWKGDRDRDDDRDREGNGKAKGNRNGKGEWKDKGEGEGKGSGNGNGKGKGHGG